MSASNFRIREYETVHHITSRIAHRVFFLGEDERNDILDMIRRAAEFAGIRLLAWCIMTNHFHLLVHLPAAIPVDEAEVLRRYGVLKGGAARLNAEQQLFAWRAAGASGASLAAEWLDSQRRRMYDVGEYMKIVKQWFTEDYNQRHAHVGTLWESAYRDKPVDMTVAAMSQRMGYVHLNPINAAIVTTYDGYVWSSFSAFVKGDPIAIEGMRFVYDDNESSLDALHERHTLLMDEQLREMKRQRAEEIARKRAAGYEVPPDALTTEAMIAQAAANLEKIRKASEELAVTTKAGQKRKAQQAAAEQRVADFVRLHADFSAEAIAEALGLSRASVFRHLKALREHGLIV